MRRNYILTIEDWRRKVVLPSGAISGTKLHKELRIGPMERKEADAVLAAIRAGLPKGFVASVRSAFT